MNLQTFLLGLLIASTLTSLATEGVKAILTERNKRYYANTLAGIVSLFVSGAIGVGYIVLTNTAFSTHVIVYFVALVFMGWLCAMVGYDKVVQAISQFKTSNAESTSDET